MKLVKVGAAAMNQTPLDWDGNRRRILAAIEEARSAGISILCLPELCISGYGCEDAFLSPSLHEMALRILGEIVPESRDIIVSVGLPVLFQNGLFNTACLLADGRILGFVAKRFLAGDGLHYEPRWFKPWPDNHRVHFELDGETYPMGDLLFDCGGIRIGFEICEDAWVAGRPGTELTLEGADVILNPSASHFAFGKQAIRERLVLEGSRSLGVTYVYANPLGNEAGRIIYDGGNLIASAGELAAVGPRFSFAPYTLTTAVVDIEAARIARARTAAYRPDLERGETSRVRAEFGYPDIEPEFRPVERESWETGPNLKEEEFTRAVALGLHDYLRKSRSSGFVVSLSGGADSAATACLVHVMVRLAAAELGEETFRRRMACAPRVRDAAGTRELVHALLTTVYQSTRNSTRATRDAARTVAEALGADHLELDVDPLVEAYVSLISKALGRPLRWETDDVTLQNIQARVRAPGVWMIANVRNALLLATSNRSEAAVGYATMDGDTSGGLSPIAGIDKAFLRRWLLWMEREGPHGAEPIPALAVVNRLAPTAELRPPEAGQTDERDLMPYDLLDAIERAAIRDRKGPLEVYRLMRSRFAAHPPERLVEWIERFFRLWCRNQWKRERYAPSFHVDDENLDPKTWCRFPILSGGFERELAELREYVSRQ